MTRAVCIHRVSEVEPDALRDFTVVACTTARQELLNALGAQEIAAVVLDLDHPDAINTVVAVSQLRPDLGLVGVTGGDNVQLVIDAQRAGCTQFATRPLDLNDLRTALRQAMSQTGESPSDSETIALIGATGGAGSTTIASYLAVELAQVIGGPVALFDLDFEFGGVARGFDLDARYTIADLASAGAVDSFLLDKAAVKLPSGVHVFARPRTVPEAHTIDERLIPSMLRAASRAYRCVTLDLSHHLNSITGAAIEHCHKLLLVLQLTVPNVDNARRIIDAISSEGIPEDRVELVVNRYRKNVHNCTVEMVEQRLRREVLAIVPNDYRAVHRALDTGKPLGARSPVRVAIRQLARRIAGDNYQPGSRSWLAKLGLTR